LLLIAGTFAGGAGDRGSADVLRALEDVNRALREGFEATHAAVRDSNMEKVSMSNATRDFTTALLEGLDLKWVQVAGNTENGENFSFSWQGGEEKCTRSAIVKLQGIMGKVLVSGDDRQVDFRDVRSRSLHTLRACGKESTGQTDVVITFKEHQHSDLAKFAFVIGIVELKTDKAELKGCQQLLELVAMSQMSQYGQGVALLGTDLNSKWEVLYFDNPDHITVQAFQFGSVAISFFREKLQSMPLRLENLKQASHVLPPVAEMGGLHIASGREQDLGGFDRPNEDVHDRLQGLKALERYFNENCNANVTLPLWAQSSDAFGIYS